MLNSTDARQQPVHSQASAPELPGRRAVRGAQVQRSNVARCPENASDCFAPAVSFGSGRLLTFKACVTGTRGGPMCKGPHEALALLRFETMQ